MKLLVEGQKISSFDSPPVRLVAGSTEFVPIELQCSSEWDGLLVTVQFIQKGKTINKYIGEARTLNVPADVSAGWLMISCFGAKADTAVFGTVNGYELEVYPAGLSSTEQEPIPPTPNLYNQLISEIKKYAEETEASADKVSEAQKTSAEAKEISDQIKKNAEDGVYNGKDGEQGPPGIQGPTGPQGLKGDPGTTDFNLLQNIPLTPITAESVELTTLEVGAYVLNREGGTKLLVSGQKVLVDEGFPKGTIFFKADGDENLLLLVDFGIAFISNYKDLSAWGNAYYITKEILDDAVNDKQDKLVSGENIKTINNESLLGSGNFELPSSPIKWHIDEINIKEAGWYYYTKDFRSHINLIITTGETTSNFSLFYANEHSVCCRIDTYEKDEHGELTDNLIGVTILGFTSMDFDEYWSDSAGIGINSFKKENGKWNLVDEGTISLSSLYSTFKVIFGGLEGAMSQQEAGRLVTTKELDEEMGITTLNTSGIGKGLKLENQELSVNTEGLDISKATVEDADQELPATPLMSNILVPMMQQFSEFTDKFKSLNYQTFNEHLKEDVEYYTISNARDNQEMYVWLKRKDGINTGSQGVLTLDLFGNTITLGNLETDTTNIFLHIIRVGYQFAIVDFFDAISSNDYALNISKDKGTFPVLMKDQASITLRTSVGNFSKNTEVWIFKKPWITSG